MNGVESFVALPAGLQESLIRAIPIKSARWLPPSLGWR